MVLTDGTNEIILNYNRSVKDVEYTVKANYLVLDENGKIVESYANVVVGTGTGETGETVTVDPAAYSLYEGKLYKFHSAGVSTSIVLTDGTNEIVLNYRYTLKSDTSTPSEPDTSEPDDRYPPRPDPDDDDDETVIPDESTPLAPGTDDGTGAVVVPEGPGGDDTVIDDDDVPLASLPTEEIDGDETPVAAPPKTGVKTAGSVALLAGSLAVALATLKKRHSK